MSGFLTVVGIGLVLILLVRRMESRDGGGLGDREIFPYRCITITIPERACKAVRQFENRRILCRAAPLVPLPDCDYPYCDCRYQHFSDRRQEDRRSLYSSSTRSFHGINRRDGPEDRRKHAPEPRVVL